jgi:hypothetical protein
MLKKLFEEKYKVQTAKTDKKAAGNSGGGAGGSMGNIQDMTAQNIENYGYQPQYTAQTESSLFDLFQRMTGQSGLGVEGIPFDIGLPTTGLYDSLTRGIKEDYLGTPGGPEGGNIADLRAYYNNMGIGEQGINQERLAYQDMNNSLLDKAALINESQKDRLLNVLNSGYTGGQNLYSQNLAQHRYNTGLMSNALSMDYGLSNAISEGNNGALSSLLGGAGTLGGLGGSGSSSGIGSLLSGLLTSKMGGATQVGMPTSSTGGFATSLSQSPVYQAKMI